MSKKDDNPFSPKEREFIRELAEKGKSAEQIRDRLVEKFSAKRKVKLVENELVRTGFMVRRASSKSGGLSLAADNGAPDVQKSFERSSFMPLDVDELFSPMEKDFVKKLVIQDGEITVHDIRAALVKKFSLERKLDVVEKIVRRVKDNLAEEGAAPALSAIQKKAAGGKAEGAKPEARRDSESMRVPVEQFEQGKIYVYAGIGPMLCVKVKVKAIEGGEDGAAMVKLKQVYGEGEPVVKDTPITKSFKRNTRELVKPATMDSIISRLERGISGIEDVPVKNKHLHALYEHHVGSADITEVAGILCLIRGRADMGEGLTKTDTAYAWKAIKIIASEYSLVMGVEYRQSLRLIGEKAGLEKIFASPSQGVGATPVLR